MLPRRTFTALATISLFSNPVYSNKPLRKPKRLQPGDTVGLITPAGHMPERYLDDVKAKVESYGFQWVMGKHVGEHRWELAGTDEQRLEDLHSMFADDSIDAVWCIRGGYGSSRLLAKIDYNLIHNNPKVFMGMSDITALQMAFYNQAGMVSFNVNPFPSTIPDYTRSSILSTIGESSPQHELPLAKENISRGEDDDRFKTYVVNAGVGEGRLLGGNLSLVSALAGTPWGLDATDSIVFLEDVGEPTYRIDRMLTQLRQSANLHKAKGIALGIFAGCGDGDGSMKTQLHDRLGDLGVPVVYGLSFGHIDHQCVLPLGVNARLQTTPPFLELLEPSVI